MPNLSMPRVNGKVIANSHMTSSYYSKNGLNKLTEKNFVETMLKSKPDQYDKMMIRLFTDTRLYSNDLIDLVMKLTTLTVSLPTKSKNVLNCQR